MPKETTKYLLVVSPIHGEPVLLAATPGSSNEKTGNMVQVYILHPDDTPLNISKKSEDDRVCGTCPLRHSLGGACYVVLFHGPNQIFNSWVNSGKQLDSEEEFLKVCDGKRIRFGAYGDPVHIPHRLAAEMMSASDGWTAYTHAWRDPKAAFWKGKAMASCDTDTQVRHAESAGWSSFVVQDIDAGRLSGVKLCDNYESEVQCIDCMKCDGSQGSVWIPVHGMRKARHPAVKGKADGKKSKGT